MLNDTPHEPATAPAWASAPNALVRAAGTSFAYRELGRPGGVPLIFLNHWGAVLDDIDPRIVDGLARRHHVVAIDYRGIGASGGTAPTTVEAMARDTIALVRALGFARVDLLGFSLGGFVAQQAALEAPGLVRKLVLAGTGPAGGHGIDRVGAVSWPRMLKGLLTLRHPKTYLFFTSTAVGRAAARAFLGRLKERRRNRDRAATPRVLLRQLAAIKTWGRTAPHDLALLHQPVLVVNGDADAMVPTALSRDMARRIPHAQLIIYPDAGHGSVFQYHDDFVARVLAFLAAPAPRSSSTPIGTP
jgi:pimeloyl-ACP methyl ester carboxylesterase